MKGWKLKAATISQNASGKYYCSLLYEFIADVPSSVLPEPDKTIGMDYSSPNFYVDDKNHMPGRPQWFRKSEKQLAKLQRQLSHMERGSKKYERQLHRVQLLHEHIANQRKDFSHKQSRQIANAYDAVCVEDLNLAAMSRSLRLGKSTTDNGFGLFRNLLQYKLEDQGKMLIVVDKWFPSSKTCCECGYIYRELTLTDRTWVCP